MKFILLTLMTITTICANAQPVLNSNEMLPFGAKLQFKYLEDPEDVDTSIQGANVVWDFSGLSVSSTGFSMAVVSPSKTPYSSSFPTANYAWQEIPTAYRYFNLTTNKMERVGSYVSKVNTYTDPQTELVFPLTLGTKNEDTWDNTNSSFGGGIYNLECVGYGKLITPFATYDSVLQVRVLISEGSLYEIPAFFWYSSKDGSMLLTYVSGDGFVIPENATIIQSMTIVNIEYKELGINLTYNNPVQNILTVKTDEAIYNELSYQIQNMMGQVILNGSFSGNQLQIDMSGLASSTYFISIVNNNNTAEVRRLKIVKE